MIGAGSWATYATGASDAALLRLSWRARGVRVEECRRLDDDEIAALPAHMRRETVCEGGLAPYRLRVDVDGERVVDSPVRGAGVREDRPLYVFRELELAPGRHRVQVGFERLRAGEAEGRGGVTPRPAPRAPSEGRRAGSRDAVRAALTLDAELTLDGGAVALITYDATARRLVLRDAEGVLARGTAAGNR